MSSYSYMSAPNQNQTAVWVDCEYGHKLATKWLGDWYITDDNGKRVKIDPNDLFGVNSNLTDAPQHFVDSYQASIDKKEAEIEEMKRKESILTRYDLVEAKDALNGYLRRIGAEDISDIKDKYQLHEAEAYATNVYKVNSAINNIRNGYFGKYLSLFNDVLSKGKWNNQVMLAQHVQDSLKKG